MFDFGAVRSAVETVDRMHGFRYWGLGIIKSPLFYSKVLLYLASMTPGVSTFLERSQEVCVH